jgi:hypothetical protein
MAKKDNTLYYLIGAAIVGVVGYFGYKEYQKKKETPTPEPTPEPTPDQKQKKEKTQTTPTAASAAKINELQKAMIRRFVQLNRSSEYTENDAKGGFGGKSRTALKTLQPQNYESKGDPNAGNIDFWITSLNKDIESDAKESADQKTKQTSNDELKKLSKGIVDYLAKGGKAKTIVEFTAVKHQYDTVKQTYVPLNETRKFSKGKVYESDELVDRKNGQIMIKDGLFRYPTTPQNFLTYN